MSQNPDAFDPKSSWDSDEDELIDAFYRPAMATCVKYQRLAGYFSSTTFAVVINETVGFVERGGKMELVTSHTLSKQDVEQIKKAVEKPEEILAKNILAELKANNNPDIAKCISIMGYMLANDQLEIKIAIPDPVVNHPQSIYHQKTGIMYFPDDKIGTFSGSVNETGAGWGGNIEDFKCFKSWHPDKTHTELIEADIRKFEKFWHNNATKTQVHDLPEAVKEHLIKARPKSTQEFKKTISELTTSALFKKPKLDPWTCQKDGVDAFVKADFNGILKMATGTGKTSTTYFIFKQFFHDKKSTANRVLIIVPTGRDRVGGQWEAFLRNMKEQNDRVYLYTSDTSVQDKNDAKDSWATPPANGNLFVIITSGSIVNFPFNGIKPDLLVGDEVHGYGTENAMSTIKNSFDGTPYRLGLSATPERFYDPDGTKRITDFFGNIVYTLCLKDAQKQPKLPGLENVLSEYLYRLDFVPLTEDEEKRVEYWTRKIVAETSSEEDPETSEGKVTLSEEAKKACMKRSEVCKKAKNKLEKFKELLQEIDHETKNCLIYCQDTFQADDVVKVFQQLGIVDYTVYHYRIAARDVALDLFKQQNARYLISVASLNEGLDIPQCTTLILLSSSANPREFIQRRGRVLRNILNKSLVKIFDISALPSIFNEGYAGLVKSRLVQIWEFINASMSAEQKLKISDYRQQYNIDEQDLQDIVDGWCHGN